MKEKQIWRIFLATLIAALPVRLYQTLFLLEESTGFYKDGMLTTGIVFIALLAGSVLLFAEGIKRPPPPPPLPLKSLGAAVAGMFTGFLFLGQALFSLLGTPAVQDRVMNGLLAAAGLLGGAALLAAAYGHAAGKNPWRNHPLPILLPALWGCVCLVALFITYAAAVSVAENVYDTFAVVFLLLFFFAYAKLHAGMEEEKSARGMTSFGLIAVLFAAVTVLPALVRLAAGIAPAGSYPFGMYLMNGAAAAFILCVLRSMRRAPAAPAESAPQEEPAAPAENAPAEEEPAASPGNAPAGEEPAAAGQPAGGDETGDLAARLHRAYGGREEFLPPRQSPFSKNNGENSEKPR